MKHFSITLLFLLLGACSSVSVNNDGPPDQQINMSKIHSAIPKVEAPCRYGNQSTYVVHGKTYQVLSSSAGYQKVGLASWYGKKFHGHRTSCGEAYDMLAMTAASKTLPLPTYVRVVNLMNDREVIVKVNDRGPFHPNRILDLSYAAAKKLDMIGTGTALVEVTALTPEEDDTSIPAIASTQATQSYLQVGAFHKRSNAQTHLTNIKCQLALKHQKAPVTIKHSNQVYRVLIGPFSQTEQQQDIKQTVMAMELGRILEVFS